MNTKKIGNSPEEVASFLKNTSGLNASMIGDYLGEREEFPLKVMHAYVDSFNFEQMDFGEAIRYFLRGFRLPGEAQKIDRIMEKFAERYCKCNPNSFTSAETAYVLAYSVIMLNTDAHNNMVKDKVSLLKLLISSLQSCYYHWSSIHCKALERGAQKGEGVIWQWGLYFQVSNLTTSPWIIHLGFYALQNSDALGAKMAAFSTM